MTAEAGRSRGRARGVAPPPLSATSHRAHCSSLQATAILARGRIFDARWQSRRKVNGGAAGPAAADRLGGGGGGGGGAGAPPAGVDADASAGPAIICP